MPPGPEELEHRTRRLDPHLLQAWPLSPFRQRYPARRPPPSDRLRDRMGANHPGEHIFAPHPILDQQPSDVRPAWRLSDCSAWNRIQKNQVRHVEADLYRILYAYADDLAARIDDGELPVTE